MPMIWVHAVPEYELLPLCFTVITCETPLIFLTSLCIKDFEQLDPGNSFTKQINVTLDWTELDLPAVGVKFSVKSPSSGASQTDNSTGAVIYHALHLLESRNLPSLLFLFQTFSSFHLHRNKCKKKRKVKHSAVFKGEFVLVLHCSEAFTASQVSGCAKQIHSTETAVPFCEAHSISAWNRPPEHYSTLPYHTIPSQNAVSPISFLKNANELINACLSQEHSDLGSCHDFLIARPSLFRLRTLDLHENPPHCSGMGSSHPLKVYTQVVKANMSSANTESGNNAVFFPFISFQVSDCLGVFDLSCPDNFQGV